MWCPGQEGEGLCYSEEQTPAHYTPSSGQPGGREESEEEIMVTAVTKK